MILKHSEFDIICDIPSSPIAPGVLVSHVEDDKSHGTVISKTGGVIMVLWAVDPKLPEVHIPVPTFPQGLSSPDPLTIERLQQMVKEGEIANYTLEHTIQGVTWADIEKYEADPDDENYFHYGIDGNARLRSRKLRRKHIRMPVSG